MQLALKLMAYRCIDTWPIGAFCRFFGAGLEEHVVAYRCILGAVGFFRIQERAGGLPFCGSGLSV